MVRKQKKENIKKNNLKTDSGVMVALKKGKPDKVSFSKYY